VGSVLLVCEGDGEGWFESVVIGTDDDLLKLKWRDYPTANGTHRLRPTRASLNTNRLRNETPSAA
jgi:hypothetical protein